MNQTIHTILTTLCAALAFLCAFTASAADRPNLLVIYLSENGGTRTANMVKGKDKHWRGSLNHPFSGKKGNALEGGIRTPIILRWKGRLPAGKVYDRPVSSLDILPTALAAGNLTPPTDIAIDGVNLLPFLEGKRTDDPHEALFWRWRAEQAIRMGDWKLVRGKGNKAWRLIDLATDVAEANDLSGQNPAIAKRLLTRWEQSNAAFHRVVSYTGNRPFTGDAVAAVPKPTGKHPWSFWLGTEGWTAMLDARDRGLGLINPGRVHFTGGFAGQPGPNDTFGNSTSYVAGQGQEILDHNIAYEFRYELVVGSLKEIRARAVSVRFKELPAWTFATDRQGWHYQNATDHGWPIKGHVHVRLDQDDPQLISPYTFVRAEEAPILMIEAAFKTKHRSATVYWQRHGQSSPTETDTVIFPIEPDGQFRGYLVNLSDAASYQGGITRVRFDPTPSGAHGDWVKVRSIRFGRRMQAGSKNLERRSE